MRIFIYKNTNDRSTPIPQNQRRYDDTVLHDVPSAEQAEVYRTALMKCGS